MSWLKKLLLALVFGSGIIAQAQIRSVWQIGKFDQSPLEFSSPEQPTVSFTVGKSNWEKDWPARQSVGHSYRILFTLDSAPAPYLLRIATLLEQPRVPALKINVNGHSGIFYLHPSLTYYPGDSSFAYHPNYSKSTVEASIPAAFLNNRENAITITCVDDPPSSEEEQFSGLTYDALSLDRDTGKRADPSTVTARVIPTVFYRQNDTGLAEIVEAFVSSAGPVPAGDVDLEIKSKHYRAQFKAQDFGQQRISFEIPEWSGTVSAKVSLGSQPRRSFKINLIAERKWTLFVVPHTHLDVGYTDYQGKVAEVQPRVLSQAASLILQHPEFRFSMDGSWNLEQLLATRPQTKRDEILDLIRSRKMAMPTQYCNLLTGYASLETLYRSLYPSKALARRYGLPFEYANITDVPTYSGSYPSVLASSGVKYWVAAANNDRAPIFYHEHWNENSPFWWQGPDGKKVLFWYSWAYLQTQTLFGLPPGLNAVRESLPIFLQAYSKQSYKPDVALIYGTQVENTDLFPTTATFATDWNSRYAFPKLNYATFPEFFHYVEVRYGNELPTYRKDGGPYWEDGIGSDAYFTTQDRQNQNRALSAEVLSTVTHSVDPDLNPPTGLLTDVWRNIILFAEHTWASYNSITQPDHEETNKQLRVKDDRAQRAALEIEDVMNRSLSQLADQIHIPSNTLVAFNSLNWRRDAMIETDLSEHVKLVDLSSGQNVPLEVVYRKEHFLRVRFIAQDLPAVGYKCFSTSREKEDLSEPAISEEDTIDSAFYRIKVDRESGALSSLYDKQLNRELVDSHSPYKFGQYLYVTGGDGDTQVINPYPSQPRGSLAVHPSSDGSLVGVEKLPWGYSIRTRSSAISTPAIETEILVFDTQKKLEFTYSLHKNYTTAKEAVYFAFPIATTPPHFAYASQQGWVDPARDLLKGGSLEWFTIQHWMAADDPNFAVGIVPLDAPLASFGDINRGKWPGEFLPQTGTIFSYAMNNYWDTNYRAGQGGNFSFRYVVTSGPKLDGSALTRLGMDEMRPVELNHVVEQDKAGDPSRPLPPTGEGFLETSGRNVALITWKQADDGKGTIMRLVETAGQVSETIVHFFRPNIIAARLCSGVEDDGANLPIDGNSIHLSFQPFEVQTVRVISK